MTSIILTTLLVYLLVGVCSGFISGLLGLGGGVIVVPALAILFDHLGISEPMHTAIGTSLAVMILTTFASAFSHYRQGTVRMSIWRRWIIGLVLGAVIGAYISAQLSTVILTMVFAGFLVLIALKILFASRLSGLSITVPNRCLVLMPVGLLIGCLSGLLGIGGGVVMVPLLLSLGCEMNEAAGTSVASSFPLAIMGAVSYLLLGDTGEQLHGAWRVGYIYLPAFITVGLMGVVFAPIGARLAKRVPSKHLKKVFAVILLFIGLHMLLV